MCRGRIHLTNVMLGIVCIVTSIANGEEMKARTVEFQTSGSQLAMRVDKLQALFTVPPAESVHVNDEPHVLKSEKPSRWTHGTHLDKATVSGIALPDCVSSRSIVVKLPDGTTTTQGTDYELDPRWGALGRLEGGRISTDTQVLVSYDVGQMRLDSVVLRDGKLEYVKGTSRKSAPPFAEITTGAVEVARVFLPYHSRSVEPWQVFVIGPLFPEPDAEEIAQRSKRVEHTLAKLRKGEAVKIVTWGDSVTVGIDASPGKAFADLFITRLRERFPKARITHVNAGIGGSSTGDRSAGFDREVMAHDPDLVTIEFVNDMGLPAKDTRTNHEAAIAKLRKAGVDTILITPHFTLPEWMGHEVPRGPETRPNVAQLRQIANEQSVGLADVSGRWENLEAEGIPYLVYLENGINHPDDRGHELFVKELMTFFPEK